MVLIIGKQLEALSSMLGKDAKLKVWQKVPGSS